MNIEEYNAEIQKHYDVIQQAHDEIMTLRIKLIKEHSPIQVGWIIENNLRRIKVESVSFGGYYWDAHGPVVTILALADGCEFPYQIVQKVTEVFSDKKEGIIFSSIHRAKGDEANNIYILNPQLIPHKMATSAEDVEQESHILFVALSRSKDKMIFVGGPVPEAFESQGMWEEEEDFKDELVEEMIKGAQTLLETFDTSTKEGKAEYIKFLQTDGNR